jgi:acyl-CoA synthetase (AMP-forming)/AMP-acid ligase II/thioesterase domain-containing protein
MAKPQTFDSAVVDKTDTIAALLRYQYERIPDHIAMMAPGRIPLTYGAMRELLDSAARDFCEFGFEHNDRVALVLPVGAELALAFLAVTAAGLSCAPLNPAYGPNELEFYLTDLQPKAVIVPTAISLPVRDVAARLGISLIELGAQPGAPAGIFCLTGSRSRTVKRRWASGADVALVLHTSGTTSRPKRVPLTHTNLCASARNIQRTLELNESDRCLNLMPQFHIHGLMVMLASLMAGSSIATPERFDSTKFISWLKELDPTWYSAVPTIHQAVLARLQRNQKEIAGHRLRFIRSCSAPLSPKVQANLEGLLGIPVIQAYGMTEAAHQISSNPLPPGTRKPGSVGIGVGVDVAVMDKKGNTMPPAVSGEIVLRGRNLMGGYHENPEANKAAFVQGWFRTGDQGFIDDEGYVFINGRLKEMINRGGEKVWPQEVDDILMTHSAVAQALAFALPHPTLGETVGAAVVLAPNSSVSEVELCEFAAKRLAGFKVPERIFFLESIPRGATGKPQRIGLAKELGISEHFSSESESAGALLNPTKPRTLLENQLVQIWEDVLEVQPVGIRDDFFALGGHSLLAARMIQAIEDTCHQRLSTSVLIESSTIEALAKLIVDGSPEAFRRPLTAIQQGGSHPPFFFLHGDWDGGGHYCVNLAQQLGSEQPFYAVHPHGHDDRPVPTTIEAMAAEHLIAIRQVQPQGPYLLGGYCNGALMAHEIACRLHALGEQVAFLALADVDSINVRPIFRVLNFVIDRFGAIAGIGIERRRDLFIWLRQHLLSIETFIQARLERLRELVRGGIGAQGEYVRRKLREFARRLRGALTPHDNAKAITREGAHAPAPSGSTVSERLAQIDRIYLRAIASYLPPRYPGRMVLFRSSERGATGLKRIWGRIVDQVEVQVLPATHDDLVTRNIHEFAVRLRECLERTRTTSDEK